MCEYPKAITLSRKSDQKQDFLIRRCTEADLSDIMTLQQKVYEDIGNPDLYAIVPEENIHESILKDYCFGTYVNDRLIAFTMMIANRISYRNYGTYVGYPEDRQAECVSLEITLVYNEFRGYGLQKLFVALREEEALRVGATEALVTIAPGNEYSLANFINSGYTIIETKPLYEGAVRHILSKQL